MSKKPVNQHYVWQYHLRAWVVSNKIWCKTIDRSEPFATAPRNIASERFFYEFYELTSDDVSYLEAVISRASDERLRTLNLGWIESFQKTFSLRQALKDVKIDDARRAKIEAELREIDRTLGERYHGTTETRALPILDALRAGDASFYKDEELSNIFIDYITHQYFRTSKMRNTITGIRHSLNRDMHRTWPVEAFIYATNLAWSLIAQREQYRILFLHNKSKYSFITADQPIINLCGIDVDRVEFYYPLKPGLAIIFTEDQTERLSDCADVSDFAVERYNYGIYEKSHRQIYGNDPKYLKALAQLPKQGCW